MATFKILVFIIACINDVFGDGPKMCDLSDNVCMTNGAKNIYKAVVETIDPLHIDEIKIDTPNTHLRLYNVTLTGLKNCEVLELITKEEYSIFEQYLKCPELILNNNYEIDGEVGTFQFDGKSSALVTATDYEIITLGIYGIKVSDKDEVPHYYTKSFDIKTNAGKLMFKSDKLETKNGEDITEKYARLINENWAVYKNVFLTNIIKKFMTLVMERIDAKLDTLTLNEVFPQNA